MAVQECGVHCCVVLRYGVHCYHRHHHHLVDASPGILKAYLWFFELLQAEI